MKHRPTWLDIDQLLIFFLLAVTINQMGHYLSTFAPSGLWWIGYLQAIAIDFAIWRSAWWYRRYTGRKQRRWALAGLLFFSVVSAAYNFGYYTLQAESVFMWQRILMAIVLPVGVALLSYLKGQKDESEEAIAKRAEKKAESEQEAQRRLGLKNKGICRICEAQFEPDALNNDGLCGTCQRRKDGKTHAAIIDHWSILQVLDRDERKCYYCGADVSEVGPKERHIDHFIPQIAGGETSIDNLVTSCKACNLSKSDKMPSDIEQRDFDYYLKAKASALDKRGQILYLIQNDGDLNQSDIARILKTSQGYVSSIARQNKEKK